MSLIFLSISSCDYRIESERHKARQGDRQMAINTRKKATDSWTYTPTERQTDITRHTHI